MSWGWRVPFLISILLVGVGFIVRLKLAETPHFKEVVERKEVLAQPVLEVLRRDWRSFLLAIGITVSEVGLAYLLTVFTVVYATTKLGLPRQVILNAVVYAAIVEFATLPLAGWLSDIFGRKALYLAGGVFSVALAFPLFWFLDTKEPALITLALVVTMTLTHALLFGPKAAFMPELFRTQVRYSGASLGANVAAALSGGFSPLIATALLAWAGSYWPVSVYIIALSIITIIATLMAPETRARRAEIVKTPPPACETCPDAFNARCRKRMQPRELLTRGLQGLRSINKTMPRRAGGVAGILNIRYSGIGRA